MRLRKLILLLLDEFGEHGNLPVYVEDRNGDYLTIQIVQRGIRRPLTEEVLLQCAERKRKRRRESP